MKEHAAPWEQVLLPATGAPATSRHMKLLRKGEQPFLLLPQKPRLRAAAMALYAPQSKAARWMKRGFGIVSRLGFSLGLENLTVSLRADDPFVRYLNQVAQTDYPQFAILPGNPNAPGQRCIFLLFDAKNNPIAVVKTSGSPDGRRLISQEINFLKNVPQHLPGIPKLRSVFVNETVSAFAMDFCKGVSPRFNDQTSVHKLLSAWAEPARVATVADTVLWKRLLSEAGAKISQAARELGGKHLCTVTHHGDFAPWNIRVHAGNWIVLDWERGEFEGLPVWDWLHFIVQPAILVHEASAAEVLLELTELFANPFFLQYAEKTKTRGLELALTCAYFDYCMHVTKQTEGIETISAIARLIGNLFLERY